MTLSDPKPVKRIRDPEVIARFYESGYDCLSCGHGRIIDPHHVLLKSQGGDDVPANLVPLCRECHGALHGRPYRAFGVKIDANHVRQAIARCVRSEAGEDTRWYLVAKLGAEPSVAFLERLEA